MDACGRSKAALINIFALTVGQIMMCRMLCMDVIGALERLAANLGLFWPAALMFWLNALINLTFGSIGQLCSV